MHLHVRKRNNGGTYVLRIIVVFTDAEAAAIEANGWWSRDLYKSQNLLDALEHRTAVGAIELDTSEVCFNNPLPLSYLWSAIKKQCRVAAANSYVRRGHHITIADIAQGIHLEADLDEITTTESLLMQACTQLAAKLDAAHGYDDRAVIIPVGRQTTPTPTRTPRRIA